MSDYDYKLMKSVFERSLSLGDESRRTRILALNGGGVRGIYQATFLKALAVQLPVPLKSNFEVIAGTSTGAIIAAALACDIDMAIIEKFYKTRAGTIFESRLLTHLRRGARYDQRALRAELVDVFGNRTLGDCEGPTLLIATTMLDNYSPRVFTNFEDATAKAVDRRMKLVDAILASAAAPSYFDPVQPELETRTYIDGGLWANSPALMAVILARQYHDAEFRQMRVLSVGNGRIAKGKLGQELKKLLPLGPGMATSVIEIMFESQVRSGDSLTMDLVGAANVLRIDDETPGGEIGLDDVQAAIRRLPPLAESRANRLAGIIRVFLAPPEPPVSVKQRGRAPRPVSSPVVGYELPRPPRVRWEADVPQGGKKRSPPKGAIRPSAIDRAHPRKPKKPFGS